MDAAMIRQGELVGRGVMAYETAEEVGTVEHLLVDVKLAQVVGLVCKAAGLMGRKQSLSWSQLVNVGRDSVVVHTVVPSGGAASESPLAAAQNMTGLEVWTDGGDHIGRVVDLCLDQATGKVQQYLFALNQVEEPVTPITEDSAALAESSGALAEEETVSVYAIEPQAIISAGRKRMMIAEEDARRSFAEGALPSQPYAHPLTVPISSSRTSPSRTAPWRPEQLPEMPNDFNELLQKGQSFAGKVTNQIKQRARQFTDEQLANQDLVEANSLPDITEQLQSKTEQVKQQMQAQLKKAREKAQDQIEHSGLEDRLGNTSLGRSLGQRLDRFKRPKKSDQIEPIESIDVDAFEVWEDD